MKILQIVHSFPPENVAGTEIYTYSLSRELLKNNEVSVFYRISDLKKKEYDFIWNNFNGLNVFTINNTFRLCNSFEEFYRNDDIAKQFAKVLDKIKPDVAHIQHLIFLSVTIIEEIKKRRIPIVFTLHDYWLICPQWHFLKKDLSICGNNDISQCVDCLDYQLSIRKLPKKFYLTLRNIVPNLIMRLFKNIYLNLVKRNLNSSEMLKKIKLRIKCVKELCSKVDLFIAPSQFLKRKFIEFGIPENKIEFIPYGIDKESFIGFKRKVSDRIRFGFIGTVLPAKGVEVLISAFNRIKDSQTELRIYGKLFSYKGFEYYLRYIRRLVKNKNIQFMGGFDHKDISDVFSEIDVLVVPSVWNENCPLIILEAFSSMTPLIASRIGGIPELISDGVNGLLFNPRDENDLQEKMQRVINNPGIIEKFREYMPKVKGIEDNAREMEEIYRKLMSPKKTDIIYD